MKGREVSRAQISGCGSSTTIDSAREVMTSLASSDQNPSVVEKRPRKMQEG
jgi:hypothetical protein